MVEVNEMSSMFSRTAGKLAFTLASFQFPGNGVSDL